MFSKPKNTNVIALKDGLITDSHFDHNIKVKNTTSALNICIKGDTQLNIYYEYSQALQSDLEIKVKTNSQVGVFIYVSNTDKAEIDINVSLKLEEGCTLNFVEVQELTQEASMKIQKRLVLEDRAKIDAFSLFHTGLDLSKSTKVTLGTNTSVDLRALMLGKGEQKRSFMCEILHHKNNAKSNVYVKEVLNDQSRGKFDVLSTIDKQTKNSNVKQANHALILSDKAKIHAKPHMQIFSDDLSASHGCTVGELDEEAIFYLMSRGISMQKAKQTLIKAFVEDTMTELDPTYLGYVKEVLGENYANV